MNACKSERRADRFLLRQNQLYYRDADGELKTCLTSTDTQQVLQEFHAGAIGGHFGQDITIARVRQQFWWPTIWRDVAQYVKTCDMCQRYGPKDHHNPLRPFQPAYLFEIIFLDFVVNLPSTARKNHHLITMTEGLTKWIEAKPVKDATASVTARFLLNDIIHHFGVPTTVITDNGSHFHGEFSTLCKEMGIHHRFGTAYHPQTNGQDERTNGLLLGRIRKWQLEKYNKWDKDLPASILACNTHKISTTSFSAMESLMGYTAGTASGLKHLGMKKKELKDRMNLVIEEVPAKLLGMRLRVLESLRDEALRVKSFCDQAMKVRYDKKVHERVFEVGTEVMLYDMSLVKQWSRKLEERWLGPFKVTWKGTLGAYEIDLGNGKTKMVSGDQLKQYHHRDKLEVLDNE